MVSDPHSKIVALPEDLEMQLLLQIFTNTPFTFGQSGINGLHYEALQNNIKWSGLSRKKYTATLMSCVNYFIKGIQSKN